MTHRLCRPLRLPQPADAIASTKLAALAGTARRRDAACPDYDLRVGHAATVAALAMRLKVVTFGVRLGMTNARCSSGSAMIGVSGVPGAIRSADDVGLVDDA
jgi:hypothetical protein